ncbi:MAG: hypothetical protein ABSE62_04080 [Chthoniobacteraceae bacterium]|jgi:hypothetical protein
MSFIAGVIPMLVLAAFAGGIAWAGRFCKNGVAQFFVGILLGLGILLVIAGVAFAGCCLVFSQMGPMR